MNRRAYDRDGDTALTIAVWHNHTELVHFLLSDDDTDLNAATRTGETALLIAATRCSQTFQFLYWHPRTARDITRNDGRNSLMLAAQSGNHDVVEFLLKQGVNVNSRDKFGNTALLLCVMGTGDLKTFQTLHNQDGVNRMITNNSGMNALMWAVSTGHCEVVEFLLNQPNTEVNLMDNAGCRALHHAAGGGDLDIFQTLFSHPHVDQKVRTPQGFSVLMVACFKAKENVVKFLLSQKDVDVNETDNEGNTALLHVASEGNLEIFKAISEHSEVDKIVLNKQGQDVLICAARNGNSDIVKFVASCSGWDVDQTQVDATGRTALQYAQEGGDWVTHLLNALQVLLDSGGLQNGMTLCRIYVVYNFFVSGEDLWISSFVIFCGPVDLSFARRT